METENNILSSLKRSQKPAVPNGFFDRFVDDLMREIEMESGILGQLKKTEKPEIPTGFFDKMLDGIVAENQPDEVNVLDQLKRNKLPVVPEGFFDQFENELMEHIATKEKPAKKSGRIIPLRVWSIAGSIAAVFALLFLARTYWFTTENEAETIIAETTVEATADDQYETYLTYLDEDEIIDYIVENEVDLEDTSSTLQYDDYIDFSGEDIEDFYMDL